MKEYLKIIDEIIALVGLHAEFNLQMQQNSD